MSNDLTNFEATLQNAFSENGNNVSDLLHKTIDYFPGYTPPEAGNLPGKNEFWKGALQTVNWYVNPLAYSAEKNAETARINTERQLQYQIRRDQTQFKLQATGQLLQYVQHQNNLKFQGVQGELNRSLQRNLAELQRKSQEQEGEYNRQTQIEIAKLQQELHRQEGLLNREANAIECDKNRKLQVCLAQIQQELHRQEGILNRELQSELAALQRELQQSEGKFNRDHALKLELLREKLQVYLFEQQRQLQLELQHLNANLAREIKGIELKNGIVLMREKRRAVTNNKIVYQTYTNRKNLLR